MKSKEDKKKHNNYHGSEVNSVISIEPVGVPRMSPHHLMTIDHGLNRENILSDDEGTDCNSIKVQRNALALMPTDSDNTINNMQSASSADSQTSLEEQKSHVRKLKNRVFKEPVLPDIEELNVGVSLNIDDLESDAASSPNTVFIEEELRMSQSLHSSKSAIKRKKNKNDEMGVYENLPLKHSKSMAEPIRKKKRLKSKSPKKKLQHRHSLKKIVDSKEYDEKEYQFENGGGRGKITSPKFHKGSFDLNRSSDTKYKQRRSLHQPQIRKYRNPLQHETYRHRHSINTMNRQQYAKRKLNNGQTEEKNKKEKTRSQSKPTLRSKRKKQSKKTKANLVHDRSHSPSTDPSQSHNAKPPFLKHGSSPNIGSKRKRDRFASCSSLVLQPGSSLIKSIRPNDQWSPVYSLSSKHSKPSRNSNDSRTSKQSAQTEKISKKDMFSYVGSSSMKNLNQFPSAKPRRHRRKRENKSLSVHHNSSMILQNEMKRQKSPESLTLPSNHHQFAQNSIDVDAIKFGSNGVMNIDMENLKELDPIIPNPDENVLQLNNNWDSQSESSEEMEVHTPTTGGGPSQLEGVKQQRSHDLNNYNSLSSVLQSAPSAQSVLNNSDARSYNPSKHHKVNHSDAHSHNINVNNSDAHSDNSADDDSVPPILRDDNSMPPIIRDTSSVSTLVSEDINNINPILNSNRNNPFGNNAMAELLEDESVNVKQNVYKVLELNKKTVTLTQKIPSVSMKSIDIPPPPQEFKQNNQKISVPEMPIAPIKYDRGVSRDIMIKNAVHISLGSSHKIGFDSITNHLKEDRGDSTDSKENFDSEGGDATNNIQFGLEQREDEEDESTMICNLDDDDVLNEEYDQDIDSLGNSKYTGDSARDLTANLNKYDQLSTLALGDPSSFTNEQRQGSLFGNQSRYQSNFSIPPPPPHDSNIEF